jgi:hypothetical protein
MARLEISGIGCGTPQDVHNRVDQKVKQISKSKSLGKLGIVAIIEFSSPTSRVVNA